MIVQETIKISIRLSWEGGFSCPRGPILPPTQIAGETFFDTTHQTLNVSDGYKWITVQTICVS